MYYIILIIGALMMIEFLSFIIYSSKSFKILKTIYDSITKRKSARDDIKTFTMRYDEHPFLAMTLNSDFHNSRGEKIHNKYGFRHSDDFEWIGEKNNLIIYCAGSSTTYGNFIEKNDETWPTNLETKINQAIRDRRTRVINAACGGWNLLQSIIRFIAWVDLLKPDLVILYHGKTDLWPFANSDLSVQEIFPDYGNVMFSLKVEKEIPLFARYSFTGKVLYGIYINKVYGNVLWRIFNRSRATDRSEVESGLKRIGEREWTFIMSKFQSFISLCESRDIPILLLTEINQSEPYKPYIDELTRRIKTLENRQRKCFVYDIASEMRQYGTSHFDFGGHFTLDGSQVFAGLVERYIMENIEPFKMSSRKRPVVNLNRG